jgi:o-succinylbenzoate---CoA ligase
MWQQYQTLILNENLVDLNQPIEDQFNQILLPSDETNAIISFLLKWANASDWIELKTSGSTGEPKTIQIPKNFLIKSAQRTCSFFHLNNQSIGLLCLPATYIAGQMMLVRAMVTKMNLIVVSPRGNPVIGLKSDIDFAAMVPNQVMRALETPIAFNHIKTLIIGGGQVNNQLINQLGAIPTCCYETFGMTETLSHIAVKQVSPIVECCFTTLPDIKISQSPEGNLIINDPELELENLETHDLIEKTSENQFRWIGRSDFVINSGGIKVSPEELESQLAPLINQPFCISSKPDERFGNNLVLVIEGELFDTTQLVEKLKVALHSYLVPKEVIFIGKFPINHHGKLDRRELHKIVISLLDQSD